MSLSKQDKQDLVGLMADMLEEVVLPQIQLNREEIYKNRIAIELLDKRVGNLESKVSRLEIQVNGLENKVSKLEIQVNGLKIQVVDLTKVMQAVRKDQLAHQLKLDHHDKQILKLEHVMAIR